MQLFQTRAERPSWRRRILRWIVLFVILPYTVLVVLFTGLQRQLIYPRSKRAAIDAADTGLAPHRIEDLTLTTNDGLQLRGWVLKAERHVAIDPNAEHPPAEPPKRVMLYFPGNAGCRLDRVTDCRDFSLLGIDVVIFDYRGYADNPGSPSETGIAADASQIYQFVTQRWELKPDQILLFGESLGGGVATRLCADLCKAKAPPAALILSSTFSSMTDAASWHFPYFPVRLMLRDRFASDEAIPQVSCPILQFHGTQDETVPIQFGQKLFSLAPGQSDSGVEKQFIEIPRASHNDMPRSLLQRHVAKLLERI